MFLGGLVKGRQTGGCSSFSGAPSVRSGRADIFANTPSDPNPPPITRGREPDEAVSDVAGTELGAVGAESRAESLVDLMVGVESWRTNLALSSVSSSLASSSSKASARSLLTRPFRVGEEAREWKDGGGELGTRARGCGTSSCSSSSWAFTCNQMSASASKVTAMRAHIPSRNAQTWLLLGSAQVTQRRGPGERVQCRNRLVTSARGKRSAVGTKEMQEATKKKIKRRGLVESRRR